MTSTEFSALVAASLAGLLVGAAMNRMLPLRPGWGFSPGAWAACRVCGKRLPWRVFVPGGELFPGPPPPCGHRPPRWHGWNLAWLMLAGAALALAYRGQPWPELGFALALLFVLHPLAVVDAISLSVEMRLVLGGLALRFVGLGLHAPPQLPDMIGGMLVGAGLFTMVEMAYRTLRNRVGLGEGDAAVMGLIGAFVGWQGVLPVVALSAIAGLAVGVPWLWWRRGSLAHPLPYVPFLATAAGAVYLLQTVSAGRWWPPLLADFALYGMRR